MLRHNILTLIVTIASFFTVFAFVLIPEVEAYAGGEAWDYLNNHILEYENQYWYSDSDSALINLSENPEAIYSIILGINNENLSKLMSTANDKDMVLVAGLSGKFLLAVEDHGRVWYLNPYSLELEELILTNLDSFLAKNSVKLADFGSYYKDVWTNELLDLVNEYRIENGVAPLVLDSSLGAVAYDKAKEMFIEDYFAHISPNNLTPGQRLNNFSYPWIKMGENLAIGRNEILAPKKVFSMWLASSGHRANILNQDYTKIGLAFYNNFWVQEFVQN